MSEENDRIGNIDSISQLGCPPASTNHSEPFHHVVGARYLRDVSSNRTARTFWHFLCDEQTPRLKPPAWGKSSNLNDMLAACRTEPNANRAKDELFLPKLVHSSGKVPFQSWRIMVKGIGCFTTTRRDGDGWAHEGKHHQKLCKNRTTVRCQAAESRKNMAPDERGTGGWWGEMNYFKITLSEKKLTKFIKISYQF